MVVCFLFVGQTMDYFEIRRLRNEQAEDRKLMNEACGSFLLAVKQMNADREENEQYHLLLLKHNHLLIKNLENERLEKPDVPKILQLPKGRDFPLRVPERP